MHILRNMMSLNETEVESRRRCIGISYIVEMRQSLSSRLPLTFKDIQVDGRNWCECFTLEYVLTTKRLLHPLVVRFFLVFSSSKNKHKKSFKSLGYKKRLKEVRHSAILHVVRVSVGLHTVYRKSYHLMELLIRSSHQLMEERPLKNIAKILWEKRYCYIYYIIVHRTKVLLSIIFYFTWVFRVLCSFLCFLC